MEHRFFVGIDCGSTHHQVLAVDAKRTVLLDRKVEHSGPGLAKLADLLDELSTAQPDLVAVAIEAPRGPVVETLLERGVAVYAINPKQLDRFRDRHTVAGAKDDRRDALVLADSLRTDAHSFRRVCLDDPLVIELRATSRLDEELGEELRRLANRLRDQLLRYFPSLLQLSHAADEPWLWDVLEVAQTPAKGAAVTGVFIGEVLRQRRIRRVRTCDVVAALKQPALRVAPGVTEAAVQYVTSLLPRLREAHRQQREVRKRIDELLARIGPASDDSTPTSDASEPASDDDGAGGPKREHRDVEILQSLPGVGRIVAATMLAEASQPLAQRDYHALRAQCGVAPVTRQSGKRRLVSMRYACVSRLREAAYFIGHIAGQTDEHWRARYQQLRRSGATHGAATRIIADGLLRRLIAMLRDGTLYDPSRANTRDEPATVAA